MPQDIPNAAAEVGEPRCHWRVPPCSFCSHQKWHRPGATAALPCSQPQAQGQELAMPMRATFQEEAWQWMGPGCHSNCRFILGKAARHRSSPTAAAGAGGSAGAPAPGRMGAGDPRLPGSRALPSITRRRYSINPHVGVPPRLCSVQAGPHRCHQRPLQQQGPARELPVSSTWQRHRWKRTPRGCSSTLPSPAPQPCKERGNPSSSWGLGAFGGAGIPGTTLHGHPKSQHLPRGRHKVAHGAVPRDGESRRD